MPYQLDREEQRSRISKANLECATLKRALSPQGTILEWIKAFATPVALIGAIWTVIAGLNQFSQEREAKSEERFERSVERLLSDKPHERLAGIATLGRFLSEGNTTQQSAALVSFANALSREDDPIDRGAVLDTFKRLDSNRVNRPLLERGLAALVERNRELKRALQISAQDSSFRSLKEDQLAPLHATSEAIVALIRKGARLTDLSQIFCADCDFSGPEVDLSSVSLDQAVLAGASFADAVLRSSSFEGANILGAEFVRSNLESARLTDHAAMDSLANSLIAGQESPGPDFSCANLKNADFAGRILLGVFEDKRKGNATFWAPKFERAALVGTDFSHMRVFVAAQLPHPYNPGRDNPNDPTSIPDLPADLPLTGDHSTIWNDPLPPEKKGAPPRYLIALSGTDVKVAAHPAERFAGLGAIVDQIVLASDWDKARWPAGFRDVFDPHKAEASAEDDADQCKSRKERLHFD